MMNKQQEILKLVKEVGRPITGLDICKVSGENPADVASYLTMLFRKGCVKRTKVGRRFEYTYKKCMPKKARREAPVKNTGLLSAQLDTLIRERDAYRAALELISQALREVKL